MLNVIQINRTLTNEQATLLTIEELRAQRERIATELARIDQLLREQIDQSQAVPDQNCQRWSEPISEHEGRQ
jgi:hypothetical protein